jgi:hypothetical protein
MDVVGESVRQLITATYDEGKESDTFWVILTRVDHNVLLYLSWDFIRLWELINSVGSNGSLSLLFICDEIDETHGGTPLWVTHMVMTAFIVVFTFKLL